PNIVAPFGSSALSLAAENADLPMIKVLLAGKAKVDLNLGGGGTALQRAALSSRTAAVVTLLLDNNASIDIVGPSGTALGAAVCRGNYELSRGSNDEVVRVLLDRGANPNLWNEGNPTTTSPLMCAAQQHNVEWVRLLLDKRADVNMMSVESRVTPLM